MSQYFSFYLARKDKDGKFSFVGPYKRLSDGSFVPKALLVRSRSFIDEDDFRDMAEARLEVDEMDDVLKSKCSYTYSDGDEPYSTGWVISKSAMFQLANKHWGGMYQGYVSIGDAVFIQKSNYMLDNRYDVDIMTPEIVAETGKEDKVKMAFTAINDSSYYATTLINATDELIESYSDDNECEYYYIFDTEY